MKYLAVLLGIVFLGGCLSRTYTIEKPRTNLEIHGNQGYLFGTPTEEQKPNKFGETRKVSILEVELGAHPRKKAGKQEIKPQEEIVIEEEEVFEDEPMIEPSETSPEAKYEVYTVQKNDTLQKISEKFYGTTKKWKMLYDENRDVLKTPDRVYPGKTIKIPLLGKKEQNTDYQYK
ncbi:MAG: LysM peptidoglycan-binding domain-containing protein [Candidatus Omnitrophica bacterium]|jgi:nucleoid-associated protein YgaU|nr:LysM peptidoglycan-binding domain-containing protein [Candidatus Omnitrophota bacterium]